MLHVFCLVEFNPLSTIFGIILIKTEFKRSFFQYPEGLNTDFWSKLRVFKKRRSCMLCQIRFCSWFWTRIFCLLWQNRFYQFDEVCRLNARSKTRRKSGKCRIRISKFFRPINLSIYNLLFYFKNVFVKAMFRVDNATL